MSRLRFSGFIDYLNSIPPDEWDNYAPEVIDRFLLEQDNFPKTGSILNQELFIEFCQQIKNAHAKGKLNEQTFLSSFMIFAFFSGVLHTSPCSAETKHPDFTLCRFIYALNGVSTKDWITESPKLLQDFFNEFYPEFTVKELACEDFDEEFKQDIELAHHSGALNEFVFMYYFSEWYARVKQHQAQLSAGPVDVGTFIDNLNNIPFENWDKQAPELIEQFMEHFKSPPDQPLFLTEYYEIFCDLIKSERGCNNLNQRTFLLALTTARHLEDVNEPEIE